MTREKVRARQAAAPDPAPRLVPVTISTVSPLRVLLPGSATPVPAVAVAGLAYTSGAAGWALYREPAVGPVFPPGPALAGPAASTVGYLGTATNWDETRFSSITRDGTTVCVNLQVKLGATPPGGFAQFGTIPAGFRPSPRVGTVTFDVPLISGGWGNQKATLEIDSAGRLTYNTSTVPLAANYGFFGAVTYSTF